MTKLIGLIDYDVLESRVYRAPNYDLGLVYAYLKQNVDVNVRLVSSFSSTNLTQYDKIYIFKQSNNLISPIKKIPGYYKLPIEEYGPGFISKPLRPYLLETRGMLPDCSCYNNMILFSLEKPQSKIAWKISPKAKGGKYQPIRLYETFEGEELKKDYPSSKYCLLYDDPTDILNNKEKLKYYFELKAKKHIFLFAHDIDISKLGDTNILEQVFTNSKYTAFRKGIVATEINDKVDWLVSKIINKEYFKVSNISVKLPVHLGKEICFQTLLMINYYNHKTKFRLRLIPLWEKGYLEDYDLALLAFKYIKAGAQYMSYYEYVFNVAFLRTGVPKELIHTGEDRYEYILSRYGMPHLLRKLESWLRKNPQFEEQIFIGGSSDYGKSRRKYYDEGRGGFNIKSSIDNISA